MKNETFDTLMQENQASLYRYVRYLGADADAGQDIVQEAFVAAFRSQKQPDPQDARGCAAWLRGIARNMFLRHWRSSRSERVVADSDQVDCFEQVWTENYLRRGDGEEYVIALGHCMNELPERQREALDVFYRERKSRREMADWLKMSENGVKSLLQRIRAAVAECINRRLALEASE